MGGSNSIIVTEKSVFDDGEEAERTEDSVQETLDENEGEFDKPVGSHKSISSRLLICAVILGILTCAVMAVWIFYFI